MRLSLMAKESLGAGALTCMPSTVMRLQGRPTRRTSRCRGKSTPALTGCHAEYQNSTS